MESWPLYVMEELPELRGLASPTQLPDGALTWDFDQIFCGIASEDDDIDSPVEDGSHLGAW